MTNKKEITTKIEKQLQALVSDDRTKYVDTLIKQAKSYCEMWCRIEKIETENLNFDNAAHSLASVKKMIFKRQQNEAAKFGISVKELKRLKIKAKAILRDLNAGYSMGEIRKLKITGKDFIAQYDNTTEYAKSSRYSAQHGYVEIEITLTDLRELEKIQGVWTRSVEGNKVKYIETTGSKHRFSAKLVDGFLFGESHARTSREARNLNRRNQIEKVKSERRAVLDQQKGFIKRAALIKARILVK